MCSDWLPYWSCFTWNNQHFLPNKLANYGQYIHSPTTITFFSIFFFTINLWTKSHWKHINLLFDKILSPPFYIKKAAQLQNIAPEQFFLKSNWLHHIEGRKNRKQNFISQNWEIFSKTLLEEKKKSESPLKFWILRLYSRRITPFKLLWNRIFLNFKHDLTLNYKICIKEYSLKIA